MVRRLALVALLVLPGCAGQAQPPGRCWAEHVEESSGVYVTLSVGPEYEIYPGRDRVAASGFLPQDHVLLCRDGQLYTIHDVTRGDAARAVQLIP